MSFSLRQNLAKWGSRQIFGITVRYPQHISRCWVWYSSLASNYVFLLGRHLVLVQGAGFLSPYWRPGLSCSFLRLASPGLPGCLPVLSLSFCMWACAGFQWPFNMESKLHQVTCALDPHISLMLFYSFFLWVKKEDSSFFFSLFQSPQAHFCSSDFTPPARILLIKSKSISFFLCVHTSCSVSLPRLVGLH